jgi:hypothetical protein
MSGEGQYFLMQVYSPKSVDRSFSLKIIIYLGQDVHGLVSVLLSCLSLRERPFPYKSSDVANARLRDRRTDNISKIPACLYFLISELSYPAFQVTRVK